MNKKAPVIAVVGATGAVGREMFSILESSKFPVGDIKPFASPRSKGKEIACRGKKYVVQVLEAGCFRGVDIAFFDASDETSKEWAKRAADEGAWVIDSSGVFRMDPAVSLVVPEVNGAEVAKCAKSGKRLIAGPNCTTVQLVMALKPLHDAFGLRRINVSTYQSVSGAGSLAMDELTEQVEASLGGQALQAKVLKHPIAFNCIPQIGGFDAEGVTSEEKKVMAETRKILGLPDLRVSCTAVRVPAYHCHSESVSAEFERPVDLAKAREALSKFPGVEVVDAPAEFTYPMNITSAKRDPVSVGRLRRDPSCENGLQLWVVSDNLRKGAALNAIQIAEKLLEVL